MRRPRSNPRSIDSVGEVALIDGGVGQRGPTSSTMTTVALVDDQAMVREGFARLLETTGYHDRILRLGGAVGRSSIFGPGPRLIPRGLNATTRNGYEYRRLVVAAEIRGAVPD
jgi:hypothetical protein